MTQMSLSEHREPIAPTDPHVQPEDRKRLTGQNAAILAALQAGPRTNVELAAIALKYTSRCDDIRKAGYKITAKRLSGGTFVYTLEGQWPA